MAKSEKLAAQYVFSMMVPLAYDYATQDRFPDHPAEVEERIRRINLELREQIALWGGTTVLIEWIQQNDPEYGSQSQLENLMRLARIG